MESIKINEQQLRRIIRETLNNKEIKEAIVSHFTPYTEKDREENFRPFFGYDPRTAEERNPSYAKALRDAEERMKQRKLMKNK